LQSAGSLHPWREGGNTSRAAGSQRRSASGRLQRCDQASANGRYRRNLAVRTRPGEGLVPLPPKCPELNPVENVWQFIRDNWLSNRVFRSYGDILEHCCFAWNKLVDQPWTIMSIGLRDWAHRF
jgi:transposase